MNWPKILPHWRVMMGFAVLAALAGLAAAPLRAQVAPADKAGVSVRVTPARTTPGETVTIDGFTPVDGPGAVRVEIRKPDGKSAVLDVVPASNGDYTTSFNGTQLAGTYAVIATSPGGHLTGEGTLSVDVMEPFDELDDAQRETKAIAAVINDIVADVTSQLDLMPDTPARDAAKAKWAQTAPKMKQAVRDLGDIDELIQPIKALAADPATRAAVKPFAHELGNWAKRSLVEREEIVKQLAASRRENVRCESIERAVEGLNFAAALANLMGGPGAAVKSVIVDYVSSKAGDLAKKLKEQFKFPATETTKIAAAFAEARGRQVFKTKADKVLQIVHAKDAVKGNLMGMAFDTSSFIGQQMFAKYCEKFSGKFSGTMHAEFLTASLRPWWQYTIDFQGHLELRYAKHLTSDNSAAVAVNGEFIGQAYRFRMEEEALMEGAPGMMAGSIRFRRRVMPQPVLMNILTGTMVDPNGMPVEEKPIEVEGKAAAVFVRPYTFFVPVEGEIVDGVLALRKKKATSDYAATARVVYVTFSPLTLLSVRPVVFELPFKDGDFFLTRAMGDGGLKVKVKKTAKALVIDEQIKREKGNGRVNGTYQLNIKICNPEDKCP